jgi:hypothetical protein
MARYRNPESELNIRRIDGRRTHGFQFHVARLDIKLTRMYSDTVSGGKGQALERARHFRDKVVPSLPAPTNSWGPRTHKANSNTGVMGVSITERKNDDGSVSTYVQSTARRPHSLKPVNRKIRVTSDAEITPAIKTLRKWRTMVLSGAEF